MLESLSNRKFKYIPPMLVIMGVVQLLVVGKFLSVMVSSEFVQSGGSTALLLAVALGALGAILSFVAAACMRADKGVGYILAISLALLQLPSLLFPISLGIFWCLLPDELTDGVTKQVREAFRSNERAAAPKAGE